MAYLNLQSVGLAFDGNRLFEEINLTIEQGEKVALVGRNGADKSTLLKIIAGIIHPDSSRRKNRNHALRDAPGFLRSNLP